MRHRSGEAEQSFGGITPQATSQTVLSFLIIRLFDLFVELIGIRRFQERCKQMSINEAITLQIDPRPLAIRTIEGYHGNFGSRFDRGGDAECEPRPLPQVQAAACNHDKTTKTSSSKWAGRSLRYRTIPAFSSSLSQPRRCIRGLSASAPNQG